MLQSSKYMYSVRSLLAVDCELKFVAHVMKHLVQQRLYIMQAFLTAVYNTITCALEAVLVCTRTYVVILAYPAGAAQRHDNL